MSIPSLLPGPVPQSLAASRLAMSIQQGQLQIQKLQDQLSSGRKFVLPSEAPTAATQTLALQKLDERRNSFQSNVQTVQGVLAATDQSLGSLSDALNTARGLLQSAVGDQATSTERAGMAEEAASLIQSALLAANSSYNGRYLFAGSQTDKLPFVVQSDGSIRYQGDEQTIDSFADFGFRITGSVNGGSDLKGLSQAPLVDLNPALTLSTRLDQLNGGSGAQPQTIHVVLDNSPAATVEKDVDLTGAQTVQDIKSKLEAAFSGEAITLAVDIDPASKNGFRLTPSAGTVEVRDLDTGRTAAELGIRSAPVAVLNGNDINPTISLFTSVSDLNGGTGIGATAGTGLRIEHAGQVHIVDLNGAATVQEVLNRIRSADPNVYADISPDGSGLRVASRLSGATFSIGENGGTNAAGLGLRTMTGSTVLSGLNLGGGVPDLTTNTLKITRRVGSDVEVNLSGATTIQDVINELNAVDPGNLVASLNTTGNGISLTDNSGSGPLTVADNSLSVALGLNGAENTGTAGVLTGKDVNAQQPPGLMSMLVTLHKALVNNDQATLNRLADQLDGEAKRVVVLRGQVGTRQQVLTDATNHLEDTQITIKQSISELFDTDFATTVTQFLQQQQAMQGAMQVSAEAMKLSILQYI